MKKFAGLLLCGILLLNYSNSFGQYAESALLYSRLFPQGSARIQGMGGTQVSLGGDYSSVASNPAGLGMYNKSEFTISPGLNLTSSNSQMFSNSGQQSLGPLTHSSKGVLQIPGISFVMHKNFNHDDDGSKAIISGTFGISISKTNDFNKHFSYSGTNNTSSIIDNFIQSANAGGGVSQFDQGNVGSNYPAGLAYQSYLIDSTSNSGSPTKLPYYSVLSPDVTNSKDIRHVNQHEDVNISGGQNQANLAYGVNILDKIFIGGGVGISFIHYQSTNNFTESHYSFDINPNQFNPVNSIGLTQVSKTSGTGINANLGIIGRPVDFIQLGFSYNTPTIYSMNDTYAASLYTDYNNFDVAYYGYPSQVLTGGGSIDGASILTQSYTLKTPSHINFGATVFILKQGFISADIEMVNYSGAKLSSGSSGIDFTTPYGADNLGDNQRIKMTSQQTLNYRGGFEYRYKKFRLRGGYNFMPSPYRSTNIPNKIGVDPAIYGYGANGQITSISGGLGYRTSKFYIDLSYTTRTGKSGYVPYTSYDYNSGYNNNPIVKSSNTSNMVMVTVGFPLSRRN